jgi:hypothetical protein
VHARTSDGDELTAMKLLDMPTAPRQVTQQARIEALRFATTREGSGQPPDDPDQK